ncbi:hypothetical protein ACQB6R_04245 [Propionibacteriaceae bacterium G1746]
MKAALTADPGLAADLARRSRHQALIFAALALAGLVLVTVLAATATGTRTQQVGVGLVTLLLAAAAALTFRRAGSARAAAAHPTGATIVTVDEDGINADGHTTPWHELTQVTLGTSNWRQLSQGVTGTLLLKTHHDPVGRPVRFAAVPRAAYDEFAIATAALCTQHEVTHHVSG